MLVKFRYRVTVEYDEIVEPPEIDLEMFDPEGEPKVPVRFVSMTAGQTVRLIGLLQRELAKFPARKPRKNKA